MLAPEGEFNGSIFSYIMLMIVKILNGNPFTEAIISYASCMLEHGGRQDGCGQECWPDISEVTKLISDLTNCNESLVVMLLELDFVARRFQRLTPQDVAMMITKYHGLPFFRQIQRVPADELARELTEKDLGLFHTHLKPVVEKHHHLCFMTDWNAICKLGYVWDCRSWDITESVMASPELGSVVVELAEVSGHSLFFACL